MPEVLDEMLVQEVPLFVERSRKPLTRLLFASLAAANS